ncbi:MAG: glyoxalase [Pseudomonadota bacterium]
MNLLARSLKAFIGARDYALSRKFYRALGWQLYDITPDLTDVSLGDHHFLLQRYYEKTWCENTMLFLEVDDAAAWRAHIDAVLAADDYGEARALGPKQDGTSLMTNLIDPSGVLWNIIQFNQ